LDWRAVVDDGVRPWGALADRLSGGGVPSVDEAMRLLLLEPVHAAFRALLEPDLLATLEAAAEPRRDAAEPEAADPAARVRAFLVEARALAVRYPELTGAPLRGNVDAAVALFAGRVEAARRLPTLEPRFESPWPPAARALLTPRGGALGASLAWAALEALGTLVAPADPAGSAARLFDALRRRDALADAGGR